ncbi:MAG: EAL domain-containing protein [Geminicoccaceae bacterium]
MKLSKPIHRAVLVAFLATLGGLVGGYLAAWGHQTFVTERNSRQLADLSASVLHRAELATDYAVIAIGELAAGTGDFCGEDGLAHLNALVFERGAVKEIAVLNGGGDRVCSTTTSLQGIAAGRLETAPLYPSRNASILVQPAFGERSGMFNVLWRIDVSRTVVALINVDMLMFDIFPPALREQAFAQLVVGGEHGVAAFGERSALQDTDSVVDFGAVSARYPIEARLGVRSQTLDAWNRDGATMVIAIGALLGLALAGLASKLAVRAPDPVDLLRSAILHGEIQPYFQPIFNLRSGAIVGCEVLARWTRADGTVVFPDQFIPLVESSGLIGAMTESLLGTALPELRSVLAEMPSFKVAFNIAPEHFVGPGFLDTLDAAAAASGCMPAQMVLELTERTAFPDIEVAGRVAAEARRRGYRVSLDDTGAGHNGLTHIQDLSPDVIKVDKRFVDAITIDDGALAIIDVLVNLAARLGATLVAEGIETEVQRDRLRLAGVDEGQGYLVARPMPIAAFAAFLSERQEHVPAAFETEPRMPIAEAR